MGESAAADPAPRDRHDDRDDNPLLRLYRHRSLREAGGDIFVCAGPWLALAAVDTLLAAPAIGGANPVATARFFAWQSELVAYFAGGCGSLFAQTIHRRHARLQGRIPAEELALLRLSPADYIEAILAFPLRVVVVCALASLVFFYVLSGAVGGPGPIPVFRRFDDYRSGALLLRVSLLLLPLFIAMLVALRACLYITDPRASKRRIVLDWAFPWGLLYLGAGVGVHLAHPQQAFLAKSGFLVFLGFFSVALSLIAYPWMRFLRHRERMFREDRATEFAPRFWLGLWRVPGAAWRLERETAERDDDASLAAGESRRPRRRTRSERRRALQPGHAASRSDRRR